MGLLDTFSRKFGFTTEEDDENEMEQEDNDIDEEEEDDDEEESVGFSFRFPSNPFKKKAAPRRRAYVQDDDEDEEEEMPRPAPTTKPVRSNVIHDPRMTGQPVAENSYSHCERIVNVRQIEECREIIKCLLNGESVLLNLENIDPKDCGRVVDLLSGAAFALQGRMVKVAHLSYLLAPENVRVIEGEVYAATQMRYR